MTAPSLAPAFTKAFVEGWAQLLADRAPILTWRADLAYTDSETGIWPMGLPVDSPSRAVAIAPYPLTADPALSDSDIGLQIRSRSAGQDVRDAWALDDAIQNALLGLFAITLPTGVYVSSLRWTSGGSYGQDAALRWEWGSNFTARVNRPSTNRQ